MDKRLEVTLDEARYQAISSNYKSWNYNTMSKLILAAIDEFLAKRLSKEALQTTPKTDEEKLESILTQIGKLNEENYVKFQAIRDTIPDDRDDPSEESEIEPFIDLIWKEVVSNDGCLPYRNKEVAITREDLAKFALKQRLGIEKDKLEASMQASAPSSVLA